MGVPKFFRYISERYPCLSELARENCIPDFDNLYLDMNGIIHNCTHPDDGNIHFSLTEEEMFRDIFNYIDKLFFLIKPQKLFFLAVDGVAPRAKMNQQRSRRFRAAKDAELLTKQAKERGEIIKNTPFDSNCITPGTEFMDRLHNALRLFVKNKISTDPLWQKCRVILTGHNTPGEGEHKIMDYIRFLKSQEDFNPYTRHCLYGLDADLIILGLCTHELHFVVLREEVKFGKNAKRASIEETRFFLLHLGLFREYLELEFDSLKQYESFSISKLVDDWVLMGFLVGNDFIPHLPCLHISSNALPLVYQTYMKIYPKLGGNINENGTLNLERLEIFLEALTDVEYEEFREKYTDLQYFEAKKSKNGMDEAFDFDVNEMMGGNQTWLAKEGNENDDSEEQDDDLAQLIENSRQFCEGDDLQDITSDDEEEHMFEEFKSYKRNYYIQKLNFEEMTDDVLMEMSHAYVTALQWILNYYYKGVQSWGWYYPYHYAPFISDLKNFKDFQIKFDMGKPFLPFEQLLAVLPAASRNLLPDAYRDLFTSPKSEIIHFYPEEFATDLNGKRHEWEAVVLIPFIDEKLLLRAMQRCEGESDININDVKRNSHGPMFQYDFTPVSQGQSESYRATKEVYELLCTEKPLWRDEIFVEYEKSPLVDLTNINRNIFYPGFPTMKHLKFTFLLKTIRVRVFDSPTRKESMVLKPERRDNDESLNIQQFAKKMLNQVVFIGWPHLIKAKIIAVSNETKYITAEGTKANDSKTFSREVTQVNEHHTTRMAIFIEGCPTLVHVNTFVGSSVSFGSLGKMATADVWSQSVVSYPAHMIVKDIDVHNQVVDISTKVENIFSPGSRIFFVGFPYFGCEGTVVNPMLIYQCGRLQVSMTVLPDPDFKEAKRLHNFAESDYLTAYQIQSFLGINTRCLGRLTSQLVVILGEKGTESSDNNEKVNIGLHMRFPKQNEELCGYTHRRDNQWHYSQKAVNLMEDYFKEFPMVIDYLNQVCNSGNFEYCYESDLFPNNIGEKCITKITNWLAEQEFTKAERVPCGTKRVEKVAVESIIESIERLKTKPVKTLKLQVKPHLLMKPGVNLPEQYKPMKPIRLFDRIVVVRHTYLVPVGSRGTVIGILPIIDPNPVRLECIKQTTHFLDILLDKSIPSGTSIYGIGEERVVRVSETAVLVIAENKDNHSRSNETDVSTTVKPDSTTIPSTAAPVKSRASTTSKAPNVTAVENNLKYFDNDISKGNFVSKEDFWMPTATTKPPKHYTTPIVDKTPVVTSIYTRVMEPNRNIYGTLPPVPQNMIMNPSRTNDFNSGTEALKTLLGLQKPVVAAEAPILLPTPIVNASQFPPPQTWRSNNGQTTVASNTEEKVRNEVPLDYYSKCLPHFAPQQQLPYVNDNFYSPTNLSQKGAFIPLQVMKTATKPLPSGPINVSKIEEKVRNCSINTSDDLKDDDSGMVDTAAPTITAESLLLCSKPISGGTFVSETSMAINQPNTQPDIPIKPRKKPKIAARFDNL